MKIVPPDVRKCAVPDTNILVSAVEFGGLPNVFLELATTGVFRAVISIPLLDELDITLRRKFVWTMDRRETLRAGLLNSFELVSPLEMVQAVEADPDDDRVLECALAARADYIVSGDKHLLDLGAFRGIPIVKVRRFLDLLQPPA